MLIFWIIVFAISLFVLIRAADYFTGFSEKLGLVLGISQFIVGVTIVSIGTSLPELASSIAAVLKGSTEIVAGNVLGSNIANILLVIGLAALFSKQLTVKRDIAKLDLPLLATGGVMLIVMIMWDGKVTFGEGIIALLAYLVYFHYTLKFHEDKKIKKTKRGRVGFKLIFGLILSAFFIYLGANYTIEGVISIANILNIGTGVIALSAVAIGTSLPELLVSVSAARKGNYGVAVGNVFGSNIFNGCVVLGLPALMKPLIVSPKTISLAIPFFIGATVLFIISGFTKRIYTWEGAMYLIIYTLFIGKLFNLF